MKGWAPAALTFSVGLASWMQWYAGPRQDDDPGAWIALGVAFVGTAVVAFCFPRPGATALGAAAALGPLIVAGWTTTRGDGDGLWALIFPSIVLAGFPLMVLAARAGRSVASRASLGPAPSDALTGALAGAALAAAAFITWTEWPRGPWAELGEVADMLQPPVGFVESSRSHCDYLMTCERVLHLRYSGGQSASATCDELLGIFGRGATPRPLSDEPFGRGSCVGEVVLPGGPTGRVRVTLFNAGPSYYYVPGPERFGAFSVSLAPA